MEANIVLGGKAYCLRPTFDALSDIEKELSASITQLATKLAEGTMTLEELAAIVCKCLGGEIPLSFVRDSLLANGFSQATLAVAKMFSVVFSGTGDNNPSAITRNELSQMCGRFP